MSIRRRSTVHDFSSLRLHPDGSRVRAGSSNESRDQHTNAKGQTRTRRIRSTARDAQENWMALDAGGTASVNQRWRAGNSKHGHVERKEGGKELFGLAEEGTDETDTRVGLRESIQPGRRPGSPSASSGDGEPRDQVENLKDNRAKKRRKFYRDFSFLNDLVHTSTPGCVISERTSSAGTISPSQSVNESEPPHSQPLLPVPSSDLLKCIHYFASGHYTSCDCLFNAPKEARKAGKLRKLAKLEKMIAEKGGQRISEESLELESDGNGHRIAGSVDTIEDGMERKEEVIDREGAGYQHVDWEKKNRAKKGSKEKQRRDMYKAFDGSALMAIGMLLQEHVVEMLSAEAPEDWLQQMESLEVLEEKGVRGRKRDRMQLKIEGDDTDGSAEKEADEEKESLWSEEAGEKTDTNGNDVNISTDSSQESCSDA